MTNLDGATPDVLADPRPLMFTAADQVVALIGVTDPGAFGAPTPCSEFDVHHLVGHLIAVLGRITHVAGGGHAFDVPSMILEEPDAGWSAEAVDRVAAMRAAWADDAVLDRMLTLPWGTVPGRAAALAYVQEQTTHAWDLATAIGRRDLLEDGLAEVALTGAKRFIPAETRGGHIPFGPVVPVAEDAGAYEHLAAWLGRDPDWTAGAEG